MPLRSLSICQPTLLCIYALRRTLQALKLEACCFPLISQCSRLACNITDMMLRNFLVSGAAALQRASQPSSNLYFREAGFHISATHTRHKVLACAFAVLHSGIGIFWGLVDLARWWCERSCMQNLLIASWKVLQGFAGLLIFIHGKQNKSVNEVQGVTHAALHAL